MSGDETPPVSNGLSMDIQSLMDEVFKLKEMVAIRDQTIASQNRDLFGIRIELDNARCSLMSQGIEVQKFSQLFDSKSSEASSQAEEIRSLKVALTEAKATTDKLKAKHEFDFKRFRSMVMPCYHVGRNIRLRKMNQDILSLNPVLGGLERDYNAILEGNEAAHDGNCLADQRLYFSTTHRSQIDLHFGIHFRTASNLGPATGFIQ